MERDEFRTIVESGLRGKDNQKAAAFFLRLSLRILPLLALYTEGKKRKPFWFFQPEQRHEHLLAIMQAQQLSSWMIAGADIDFDLPFKRFHAARVAAAA